jgi:UDP-MurNAc hydroxylase
MRITVLNSASVLIEDTNDDNITTKVLCDPWLEGEEYMGSWAMYPKYIFKPENFADVDFIYISHIHQDHCSAKTLSKLDKNIPVLIHNFPEKFLKQKIQRLGFKIVELEHNTRVRLKKNLHINVLAADNCDPTICGNIMGCGLAETKFGTTQIDTIAVFDNEKQVIVNTNDCPWGIAKSTAHKVKSTYGNIDALLVGYVAASSWPHCYTMPEQDKNDAAILKEKTKIETSKNYVELFKPKYYIPFAGKYTLCGKNTILNQYRGEPELEDAYEYLSKIIQQENSQGIMLNNDSYLDVDSGKTSQEYIPINKDEKKKYLNDVLSLKKFPYEYESFPSVSEISKLIQNAYENFERTRNKIGWKSNTTIIIKSTDDMNNDFVLAISCNGKGYQIIQNNDVKNYSQYLVMALDVRLLYWLLQGPHKALWSDADLGSHIQYERVGSVYKRGLFFCLNRLYSGIF